MPSCCAEGCTNSPSTGHKMNSFPRNPERRAIWTQNLNRKNWTPTSHSNLCEIHFEPSMWEKPRQDGKKKLKSSAIPTIFPGNRNNAEVDPVVNSHLDGHEFVEGNISDHIPREHSDRETTEFTGNNQASENSLSTREPQVANVDPMIKETVANESDSEIDTIEEYMIKQEHNTSSSSEEEEEPKTTEAKFTLEQKIVAAVWVHEKQFNHQTYEDIMSNFRIRFKSVPPKCNTLSRWEEKLFSTPESIFNRPRSSRAIKRLMYVPYVKDSLRDHPNMSMRDRGNMLGISPTVIRRIINYDLKDWKPVTTENAVAKSDT